MHFDFLRLYEQIGHFVASLEPRSGTLDISIFSSPSGEPVLVLSTPDGAREVENLVRFASAPRDLLERAVIANLKVFDAERRLGTLEAEARENTASAVGENA